MSSSGRRTEYTGWIILLLKHGFEEDGICLVIVQTILLCNDKPSFLLCPQTKIPAAMDEPRYLLSMPCFFRKGEAGLPLLLFFCIYNVLSPEGLLKPFGKLAFPYMEHKIRAELKGIGFDGAHRGRNDHRMEVRAVEK